MPEPLHLVTDRIAGITTFLNISGVPGLFSPGNTSRMCTAYGPAEIDILVGPSKR